MNEWINHVKKVAIENNISYPCALQLASKTYIKKEKPNKKPKFFGQYSLEDLEKLRNKYSEDPIGNSNQIEEIEKRIKEKKKKNKKKDVSFGKYNLEDLQKLRNKYSQDYYNNSVEIEEIDKRIKEKKKEEIATKKFIEKQLKKREEKIKKRRGE